MRKQFDWNGHSITYQISGKGPAVVLLHGFGETASVWQQQQQHLEKNFLVLVPDLPGSGNSDLMDDMSLEGIAEVIIAVLQQEQISRCIMIGHSMGGYIALAFAEKYSHLLQGLGLFHSSSYADNEEKKGTRQKGIAFMQQHGGYEFLKTSVPNLYSTATKKDRPSLPEEHLNTVRNMKAESLIAYYEAMIQRPDRRAWLESTKLPVLFVLGKEDTAVPLEQGLQQCSLPNLSYIHILDRSGHMGMVEEPEKSNEILTGYVSFTLETTAV